MKKLLHLLWASALMAGACTPVPEVYDLTCEGLVEPLAIDSAQPHFSWKIASDKPVVQKAYEIEVGPDIWRSGKVESAEQIMVPYGGTPLASRRQAWWRVRVWNQDGKVSAWSGKARFGVGLLEGDMKGEFIGAVPGKAETASPVHTGMAFDELKVQVYAPAGGFRQRQIAVFRCQDICNHVVAVRRFPDIV